MFRLAVSVHWRSTEIADAAAVGSENCLLKERIVNGHAESAQGACAHTDRAGLHGRFSQSSSWKGLHGALSDPPLNRESAKCGRRTRRWRQGAAPPLLQKSRPSPSQRF